MEAPASDGTRKQELGCGFWSEIRSSCEGETQTVTMEVAGPEK